MLSCEPSSPAPTGAPIALATSCWVSKLQALVIFAAATFGAMVPDGADVVF
jgi:hypothetical protein